MRIKKLQIRNFKSLVDFELEDLKPFCAFVGPNASGKSNIFEALEFTNYLVRYGSEAPGFFGGNQRIYSFMPKSAGNSNIGTSPFPLVFDIQFQDDLTVNFAAQIAKDPSIFGVVNSGVNVFNGIAQLMPSQIRDLEERKSFIKDWRSAGNNYEGDYEQFLDNFTRIFVDKSSLVRRPVVNTKLAPDASNLPAILALIFEDEIKKGEFIEWLQILIPEFRGIEVKRSNIDGSSDFLIYEKGSEKPFPRDLISDGTNNILSLLAAVYQSSQPQFLCIEEPENGLHPQAIKILIDFFRDKCEEEGHHIWLNTHSQTLVRCLEIEEIILVNKINGATKAKQMTKKYNIDIKTDEAWLTNALGGGVL
jgi:predicted ATPase